MLDQPKGHRVTHYDSSSNSVNNALRGHDKNACSLLFTLSFNIRVWFPGLTIMLGVLTVFPPHYKLKTVSKAVSGWFSKSKRKKDSSGSRDSPFSICSLLMFRKLCLRFGIINSPFYQFDQEKNCLIIIAYHSVTTDLWQLQDYGGFEMRRIAAIALLFIETPMFLGGLPSKYWL